MKNSKCQGYSWILVIDRGINLALCLYGWSWKHEHSFGEKRMVKFLKEFFRKVNTLMG